ncbi:hypothetical protein V6N11_010945 [Hibiscus sabdariffa]|uniref:Uncharacterized protein n=1 Tax=Hibiscus sabdariffa TaxID=183260 RepID=A0ABR2S7B0_9ROSI
MREGEGGNSGWERGYLGWDFGGFIDVPRRAGDEAVVAAGNEAGGAVNIGAGGGGNAITDETSVALYAVLVEEVKGLTDELNGWVASREQPMPCHVDLQEQDQIHTWTAVSKPVQLMLLFVRCNPSLLVTWISNVRSMQEKTTTDFKMKPTAK